MDRRRSRARRGGRSSSSSSSSVVVVLVVKVGDGRSGLISRSSYVRGDVTSPSSILLQKPTTTKTTPTTRRTRQAAPPVATVQALAPSIESRPVKLYTVEGRKSRNPLEWGPFCRLVRPPQQPRAPWSTTPSKFMSAARSSVGGSSRPRSRLRKAIHINEISS
jgi:hypothetical protein